MPLCRRQLLLLVGVLGCTTWGPAAEPVAVADGKVRLFILSGQSNMAGLDPAVSFTPAVKKEFAGDDVLVVKYAQGGQPIRRWYEKWKLPPGATDAAGAKAPGDMYAALIKLVHEAVGDRKVDSVAFVWMQGERDAKAGWQAAYEESLNGIIAQLKRDLKRDDVAVVIGRLSDHLKGNAEWDAVRAAQEKVAADAEYGAWIDTDDLNDKGNRNDLHYTKDGYAELGRRFAAAASKLMRRNEKSP